MISTLFLIHVLLFRQLLHVMQHGNINASSNFEISIGDSSAHCRCDECWYEIVCDEQRMRPDGSEVNRLYGDNSRLRHLTGWQPSYGGLDGFRQGLSTTIEWFTDPANLSLYRPGTYVV